MDIRTFREILLSGRFLVSAHADAERFRDGYSVSDLLSCVNSGEIVDTDFDELRGTEYLVEGQSSAKSRMRVKIALSDEGEVVFITVYTRKRRR